MAKYRKKPVVVEAFQLPVVADATAAEQFHKWAKDNNFEDFCGMKDGLDIDTLEGVMRAKPGDFIIKGVKGEFYPCKPGIFEQTYEKVEG